jgi:hypothetical protein
VRIRQVRHQVAAFVIGNYDPGKPRIKVVGFRDHPDASLRAGSTPHYAGNIVVIHGDGAFTGYRFRRFSPTRSQQDDRKSAAGN